MKIIDLIPQKVVKTAAELMKEFNKANAAGLEGVVAKKLDSVYQAGARNFNWVKFKKAAAGKLMDTLDCLVMGYYAGRGKRSGFGIGAFLVGVRDDRGGQEDGGYLTISKIGTGLTDEQWKKLKAQSSKLKAREKPVQYLVEKTLAPDVWLKPALVVEIAADEITKSPVHTASLALRFPRLLSFREDKSPEQVTTLSEVKKLFRLQ